MKQIAKKSLALLLAVCFMLTTAIVALPLSVSAAEATKCATWADVVAAVEADSAASIKLTNHVTANSTIASFAGTFDGNGYTVTVEKTMFAEVTGTATLKNFQTVAAAAITVAPIVNLLKGNATVVIENVVNNVDVAESTEQMGGIIAKTSGTVSLTMTSCVNNGNLQTLNQASGIVGNADGTLTVDFTDVVNNGNITGNQNYAAGILCTNGGVEGTMTRVVNNGDIVIESKKANNKGSNGAGIIGTAKGKTVVTFTECVNTGDVTLITENTSAHYGVSAFATRTDNESSVFTLNGCVSTGVMTSATAGTTTDAIAVPLKNGAASATNCTYSSGTSTIAGATKVDAATAQASIDAIKAKMTLPTFDANKAPETDTPAGDTPDFSKRFSYVYETQYGKAVIDGPLYMTVGSEDAITVTFTGPSLYALGAGFSSSNTSVIGFNGLATCVTDPVVNWTDSTPEAPVNKLPSASCGTSVDLEPFTKAVITVPIAALAVGSSAIELDEDNGLRLFHMDTIDFVDVKVEDGVSINYTINVVEEGNNPGTTDNPDFSKRYSYVYETQYGKAVIDGPLYMTVGSEDAITVTFTGPSLYALGAGFSSSNTSVIGFNGLATCVTDPVVNWTDSTPEAPINKLPSASCGTSVDLEPFTKAVITVPIAALAVGSSAIELDEDNGLRLFHMDTIDFVDVKVEDGVSINYTINVVEEGNNPDEPADNSTTLDATTGTLTVTGPATAVAGESFDVTFTWADYGFTPDTIDLNFFLNTITSKTQEGNIAVSAIKSTNLTSYVATHVGTTDVENLYKIALTDMVVTGDSVEIVVTFTSTTPGFTGFSLQYAALSNIGTGYSEINHIDGAPAEAYVIELTVPETSHTVTFKDGDTTLKTATDVAYGALLADVYTAPAKEGYTFKGWKDASGNAVTTVTGDITVYADYSVNEYTVNITVANGSATNATQKLNYAGSIDATVDAAIKAAGLKPAAGYKDSYTVSTPSVAGTTINVTVTYSTKLTYTVKFVGYNGADLGSVTVEHGKAATAPSAPAVEGYTFKNWDKAFDKVTGNLTVTAVYEINKYTVTFKGQDGATLKTETVEHGKAATAPSAPAVTGYTFSKWDKDFSKVTGTLTVTAVYTINSYNVTVTVKSEGDYAKTTANYNTQYTLPSADDIKSLLGADDIFSGWSINGKTYAAGDKVTITADTVITAILGNVKYFNVTIVDGATTTNSYAEGATFTVPAAAGKTGYTFVNWTDAKGNVYTAGQTVTVTADITLTANYKINTYTVKFIAKDGSIIKTETVEYNKSATAPAAPTVEGYTFSKWDKDFSKVTTNLEVKAVYTINSYDIVITDHKGAVKTVKANYGENVLEVVNANYTKDTSLVFVGFYNSNGTLISSTGKVTARTLVYVAYTVEDIFVSEGDTDTLWDDADSTITFFAGAKANLFTYGTVAKNGGTGDTITFTAPLFVADAVASKISYAGETATYTIIVMGDVDGDADVDLTDAELAAACIGNSKALSGYNYTAANTTYPTALITARDIAAIKAFARGDIDRFTDPYAL